MSRSRPFSVLRAPRRAILALVLAASSSACSSGEPPSDAPLAVAGPEVALPSDLVVPPHDPPAEPPAEPPVEPSTPEPATQEEEELAQVPAMFRDAIGAVFDRPSGAVDRESWLVERGVRVELFVELRWEGESGTLRRWLEAEGEGLDTPEGREVIASLDEWEIDQVLEVDELERALDEAQTAMTYRLRPVGPALQESADGWWHALGGAGFLDVGVHMVDGMVDRLEFALVGRLGDYWDVVG